MASMMNTMSSYMSQQRETLYQHNQQQQNNKMYELIAKEAHHFGRNLDSVAGEAAETVNKEIIQHLVDEKKQQQLLEKHQQQQLLEKHQQQQLLVKHQQQQQLLEKHQQQQQLLEKHQQQQMIAVAAQERDGRCWQDGDGATPGQSRWTQQQNQGLVDNWQRDQVLSVPPSLIPLQQGQVSTIRANPLNQPSVINRTDETSDMKSVGEEMAGAARYHHDNLDVQIETMDTDQDEDGFDCKTGLCSAANDQSGPEYNDISSMFNLSNFIDLSNTNSTGCVTSVAANDSSQRISVIQAPGPEVLIVLPPEGPRRTSEEEMRIPLKKRTCSKMCKSYFRKFLYAEPIMQLTYEEKKFIDKRVVETRDLVKRVQPKQPIKIENPVEGLQKGRIESMQSFRENFKNIFGALRSKNMAEIDRMGLLESRFLVCALTSIGVRMFGSGMFIFYVKY
jgi:hypothetical protein